MRMGKQRQPRSCGARTVLDISRGRRARSLGLLCSAPLRRIVHWAHYGVRVRTADLDPELDLGCLPYRERFASGARDEVHFDKRQKNRKKVIKKRRKRRASSSDPPGTVLQN